MHGAAAFHLVVAVGAVPLFGENIVHAVDDQRGVIALQRIGVRALLLGAEHPAHELALHLVFAAGLVVVPFPFAAIGLHTAAVGLRYVEDGIVAEPEAEESLAIEVKTLEQRDAFA